MNHFRLYYFLYCVDDRLVSGATTIVAGDVRANFFSRRLFIAANQVLGSYQHPWRAEAALQRIAAVKGGLELFKLLGVRKSLDGVDPAAVCLHGEHQAAAHDLAVHAHRAGAADAVLAAEVRAGQPELLAQEIDE